MSDGEVTTTIISRHNERLSPVVEEYRLYSVDASKATTHRQARVEALILLLSDVALVSDEMNYPFCKLVDEAREYAERIRKHQAQEDSINE